MPLHPKNPDYWQETDLRQELDRVYNICHGCRLCFNLCPSFLTLFKHIDNKDGDVRQLDKVELRQVTDLCYQCKLCFVKCPYTPPHQWDVDFPRLILREKAVRTKREGLSLQDRFLGDPDVAGKIGCNMRSLSNWANRNPLGRQVIEKVLGIAAERNLPEFQCPTFEEWFKSRKRPSSSENKVALFYTCFVNYHNPEQGKAVVEVLEKNGFEVIVPKQVCCGMPFLDGGAVDKAISNMEENVRAFQEVVNAGIPIVSPGPTCSYVLKKEFPFFTQNSAAERMAKSTKDLCEFLMELKRRKEFNTDFVYTPQTRIAYQIPCHLKAQHMGHKSMELLRTIPNMKVELMENCSAMDGTWGMKKQYFQLSLKVAKKLFKEVEQAETEEVCTDCPMSALQIEYGTKKKPMHPIQILHRAYGFMNGQS
jgi:glycerol-3-phosphate dehydrogenase subunit C